MSIDANALEQMVELLDCATRILSVIAIAKRIEETDDDTERACLAQALESLCNGGLGHRQQSFGQPVPQGSPFGQYQH